MASRIDFAKLSTTTKLKIIRHVFEREDVTIDLNNMFASDLWTMFKEYSSTALRPDDKRTMAELVPREEAFVCKIVELLRVWSAAQNDVGHKSADEIERFIAEDGGGDASQSIN